MERQWVGTGFRQKVDNFKNKIPEFDPHSGNHLWIIINTFKVDPTKFSDSTATPTLDTENLLCIAGPVCFFCEELYTKRMQYRRCKGEIQD